MAETQAIKTAPLRTKVELRKYSFKMNEPVCGLEDSFHSLFGPISTTKTSLPSTEETRSWGWDKACTKQTKQIHNLHQVRGMPSQATATSS